MIQPDTRTAFEEWVKRTHRRPGTHFDRANNGTYKDNRIAAKWAAWQAATEAAKATGTAGELPPLPDFSVYRDDFRKELEHHCKEYGQACAEAARQPAPVVVKTWQERMADGRRVQNSEWCKDEEIAELRAALAATNRSQP